MGRARDAVESLPRTHLRLPLTTPDGQGVGTLCAWDWVPRAFTDAQVALLSDLARLVVDLLQQCLPAAGDGLAGAMMRRARMSAADQELALAPRRWSTSTWIASRR